MTPDLACPLLVAEWIESFALDEPPIEKITRLDRTTHYAKIFVSSYQWKSEALRDLWMGRWESRDGPVHGRMDRMDRDVLRD